MKDELIDEVIVDLVGAELLPLVNVLKGKKNVSEFSLAESLKEEINTIRNKLYKLYDFGLVRFARKKDKKKGWYIYYWTFMPNKIMFLARELKKRNLEKLKEKLIREESGNFFECKNKCIRMRFEQALDLEFKCPECGSLMNQIENEQKKEQIKKQIELLEKELEHEPEIEEFIEEIEEPFGEDEEEKKEETKKPRKRKKKVLKKKLKVKKHKKLIKKPKRKIKNKHKKRK